MDLFGEELQPLIEGPALEAQAVIEEEPEAFQHPRSMQFCLGHDAVENKLLENHKGGRLAHGLIFSGPKGVGKATMAYRFAKFLLRNPGEGATNLDIGPQDPAARLVVSGGHPDLLSVERAYDPLKDRYKDSVDVEQIRKVTPFLRMTAAQGGWRVVIIDDADTMNRNAQNALLKILEEPPKNTVLILIAHRLGTLIPTIRSRAQLMNFQPLSEETIEDLLERKGITLNIEERSTLLQMAAGSFGKVLQDLEGGGMETLGIIRGSFQTYPDWNWPEIHKIADSLARNGQDQAFQSFQSLLQWAMTELALSKARGRKIENEFLNVAAFQNLLKNSSLEQLLKICENLHCHFDRANAANLDKKQSVLGAFSLIAA